MTTRLRCDVANHATNGRYRCTRGKHAGPCAAVPVKGFFQGMLRDGHRVVVWPISIKWSTKLASKWLGVHGWQIGSERVHDDLTSFGMMPGRRALYGWTFHLGRLKILFGKLI